MIDYCPTGKVPYPTRGAAIASMKRIKSRGKWKHSNRKRRERHAYYCDVCRCFHLASVDKLKQKRRRV